MGSQHSKIAETASYNDAHIEQAATWMARLLADDASEQDQINCQRWRQQHPANEQAWQRMCQVSGKFATVPQGSGLSRALGKAQQAVMSRRRFLKAMAVGGVGVAIGGLGVSRTPTGRAMLAQYRTNVGEIRTFHLQDGTELTLNTDSAVDVSFSGQQRRIKLYQGEIQLKTGHETPRRRFIVQTDIGELEALGTEFTVRRHEDHIHLAVLHGAVEARPAKGGQQQRVDAGQQTRFSSDSVAALHSLPATATSWLQGKLVAQGMTVADFVEEIARYRPGFTRYDQAVADLTISGVFSLQDTDRALQSLAASLPVTLNYRTDYWVKVVPSSR